MSRHRRRRRLTFALLCISLAGLAVLYVFAMWNGSDDKLPHSDADRTPLIDSPGGEPSAGESADHEDGTADDTNDEAAAETPAAESPISDEPAIPEPEPPTEGRLIAVGDVMMHTPQLPAYYDKARDAYDFTPYFTEVAPILSQGDWAMANLETTLSADGDYTGYPLFRSPHELAAALKSAGFDIVTTANNHSLDRGAKGVERTLAFLEEQGLTFKGTARSAEEAAKTIIVERNGIKLGLLAYTYGTNGIPVPQDRPYLVSLMDEARMLDDIRELRAAGADYIAVALHFGNEYQTQPSEAQKTIARRLVAGGADLIAGSHPHVIQPYETVEHVDEEGTPRKGIIIYSMGNFISNQRGDTKDYGIIYRIQLRKENGVTQPVEIEPIVTWVHRYKKNGLNHYRILPVEQTLAKRDDSLLTAADYRQMESTLELLNKRLTSMGAPTP